MDYKCKQCYHYKDRKSFPKDFYKASKRKIKCNDCIDYNLEEIELSKSDSKRCIECREIFNKSNFHKDQRYNEGLFRHCRVCQSVKQKATYKKNAPKVLEKAREYYYNKREVGGKEFLEAIRIKSRQHWFNLKSLVINSYGGKCSCPGCIETNIDFLTIDHSFNDGGKIREEIGCATVYRDLKKRGFPKDEGIQVLCYNCNMGKRRTGSCPHELEHNKSTKFFVTNVKKNEWC